MIDRRGLVATIVALLPGRAQARKRPRDYCRNRDFPTTPDDQCYPPGPYCDRLHDGWCDGWRCAGPCVPDPGYYPGACWCTGVGANRAGDRGYRVCCDCLCPHPDGDGLRSCGCSDFRRA